VSIGEVFDTGVLARRLGNLMAICEARQRTLDDCDWEKRMMRATRIAFCIAVLAYGYPLTAEDGATVRFATARTRQPIVEAPLPMETELVPPSNAKKNGDDAEEVLDERVGPGARSETKKNPFDEGTMYGSGLPASPYIAGLSYMKTPQPFRVPYPNRFYYPCPHFVRLCPYYPKGLYWGANWNRVYLPPNNLVHGAFRFNPYLSSLKAQKHGSGHHHHHHNHNHCQPVMVRSVSSSSSSGAVEHIEEPAAAHVPPFARRLTPDNLRP